MPLQPEEEASSGQKIFANRKDSLLTAGNAVSILRIALLEASMARSREIVAAILTSFLLMSPAWAASADALGTVVSSSGASVSGTVAPVGTTVFAGDNLSTADAGSVQLRTKDARLMLGASSAATVNEDSGMPGATLLRGSATFSTASSKAFSLNAATAVIRPKSDEPTIGQVTILSAKQLLVKCTRGELTITVGDDSRVIAEGSAYRIVLDPAESKEAQDQPPPQGAGAKGSGHPPIMAAKSKFVWYAVGAVAVVTVLAIHEALESPDRP
jgi:ferric-dicitrate binding protein FerR (iron transport regulator)